LKIVNALSLHKKGRFNDITKKVQIPTNTQVMTPVVIGLTKTTRKKFPFPGSLQIKLILQD